MWPEITRPRCRDIIHPRIKLAFIAATDFTLFQHQLGINAILINSVISVGHRGPKACHGHVVSNLQHDK
jgi:hypothetical protein